MESSQCTYLLWNGSIFSITENLRHPDIHEGPMGPPVILKEQYLSTVERILCQWGRKGTKSFQERHPEIHN